TASHENFHEASQAEALSIVVKAHEVIHEGGAAVDRNNLAAHAVQQAAAQGNDAFGNLFCVNIVFVAHELACELVEVAERIPARHRPTCSHSNNIDPYVFVIQPITHVPTHCLHCGLRARHEVVTLRITIRTSRRHSYHVSRIPPETFPNPADIREQR